MGIGDDHPEEEQLFPDVWDEDTHQLMAVRRGTVVRVREGHWKGKFAGMDGRVQKCLRNSQHAAVDVLLEDGNLELFWLPNLEAMDKGIAV